MHLNKPEDILWAEETKVKMFDHNAQNKHSVSAQTIHTSLQHGGGGIMS